MIIIIQPNETKYWGLRQQTQYYRDLILGLRFEKAFHVLSRNWLNLYSKKDKWKAFCKKERNKLDSESADPSDI